MADDLLLASIDIAAADLDTAASAWVDRVVRVSSFWPPWPVGTRRLVLPVTSATLS